MVIRGKFHLLLDQRGAPLAIDMFGPITMRSGMWSP